jgi:putative NADPH-quinone reductase
MRNIVIILGHPSGANSTFCEALARAYESGAKQAEHGISVIDIGQLEIPFFEYKTDYEKIGLSAALKNAQNKLRAAEHWVIIYPLWMGCMPAKLKAFFEWVMEPGFAYSTENQNNPFSTKKLHGKSAHIIMTMGMPAWYYRWVYRAHSLKSLERNMLKFCGISPIRTTLLGSVYFVSDKQRILWLENTKRLGKHAN